MIEIGSYTVTGLDFAIEGMRNPLNSWSKQDSTYTKEEYAFYNHRVVNVGENDLALMKKLVKAGSDHSKFMRMITVYVNVKGPLYFLKEFDTYKIGTVSNSCSTMHKIHDNEFEWSDFSNEHIIDKTLFQNIIEWLNVYRTMFVNYDNLPEVQKVYTKKQLWWQLIQMLPSSYNQKRTVMLNYAVLRNIYHSRKEHKLDEWHQFCKWIESLPYSELITM